MNTNSNAEPQCDSMTQGPAKDCLHPDSRPVSELPPFKVTTRSRRPLKKHQAVADKKKSY